MDIVSKSTERRDKLEENTKFWRNGLEKAGFVLKAGDTPIVPVMLFNAKLAQNFSKDLFVYSLIFDNFQRLILLAKIKLLGILIYILKINKYFKIILINNLDLEKLKNLI